MWNQSAIGWLRDTGLGQDRAQARTTVGERGHRGVGGPADCLEASPDQHRHVGIGPCDRTRRPAAARRRLDVADANLQMPFAVMTATDEGRIQGDRDRRRRGRRLDRGGVAKLLADFERMAAQGLGALSGLHRQKMRQHASGDTIGHQGGKMRSQLVQLRCRPTMRWPVDTSLATTTAAQRNRGSRTATAPNSVAT